MNSLSHSQSFMSSFYNNANARLSSAGASVGVGANSSSASMLVEAALNSVGNMIDSESSDLKVRSLPAYPSSLLTDLTFCFFFFGNAPAGTHR